MFSLSIAFVLLAFMYKMCWCSRLSTDLISVYFTHFQIFTLNEGIGFCMNFDTKFKKGHHSVHIFWVTCNNTMLLCFDEFSAKFTFSQSIFSLFHVYTDQGCLLEFLFIASALCSIGIHCAPSPYTYCFYFYKKRVEQRELLWCICFFGWLSGWKKKMKHFWARIYRILN